MQQRQLEIVVAIADEQSVSRAAAKLYSSASTLTYQLQQLEKELDMALFNRSIKGMTLTPSGCIIYDMAKDVLARTEAACDQARKIDRANDDTIRIGHHSIASDPYLPRFLSSAYGSDALPCFVVEAKPSTQIFEDVLDGTLDMGIVMKREIEELTAYSLDHADIGIADLFASRAVCVIREDALPQDISAVYLNDLDSMSIIMPDSNPLLDSAEWSKHVDSNRIIMPNCIEVALAYAQAGIGALVAPYELASLPQGLRQLPFEGGPISWRRLIWLKNNPKSRLVPSVAFTIETYQKLRSN